MREVPFHIVIDASMAASVTSVAQDLSFYLVFSFQAIYTGSPVGALTLEASNDGGTTWTTIADSSSAVSGASNTMWTVENVGYKAVRLVYTRTSGTGTLNVWYFGKGF